MNNLSFEEGFKELTINGDKDRVIRFNPCDYKIIERAEEANKQIAKKIEEINSTKSKYSAKITKLDEEIRKEINYVLDSDVSEIIFGKTNCMTVANGNYIFNNFLMALMKYMEDNIKIEEKKSADEIKKYTELVKK